MSAQPASGPARAGHRLAVVAALQAEWARLAGSARMRQRLRCWGQTDPGLAYRDGRELVAATAGRQADPAATRAALDGLVRRADHDPLALRAGLQVLMPQWLALIGQLHGAAAEEVAAVVFAAAVEQIVACDPDEADTPLDIRLWANTRRSAWRALNRRRDYPATAEELAAAAHPAELHDRPPLEEQFGRLVRWLAEDGQLSPPAAQLVVATRLGGIDPQRFADGIMDRSGFGGGS